MLTLNAQAFVCIVKFEREARDLFGSGPVVQAVAAERMAAWNNLTIRERNAYLRWNASQMGAYWGVAAH